MGESLPDRASNAGPEPAWSADADWRDWLCIAEENCAAARRMEKDMLFGYDERHNRSRIAAIDAAMNALKEAKELLCR